MLQAHASFRSSRFPVEPGEDRDTNPGIYGRSLARWLSAELQQRGHGVEAPIAEDFGQVLMLQRRPFLLWVGCASVDDSSSEWQMQVVAEVPLLARLLGKVDAKAPWARLCDELDAILRQSPDIQDLAWHRR